MKLLIPLAPLVCVLTVLETGTTFATPVSPAPQEQADLKQMLKFTWSAGTHLPQGMQDNHVAFMDGWLVNMLGFCSGADKDWKPGVYTRGFFNTAWGLDLTNEGAGWVGLPDFPGAKRQAGQGAVVG
ncbi:MAG: hypothetical protein L3K26_08395, partial [Candidatus Hydrogenedentes bacterium]|nr:hypothetical protein [Candidatus Hydrogenedentota bacterium]